MSVVHQQCPSCSAPIDFPTGATKVKCPFCGTSLAVNGQGSEIALALAGTLATTIEKSGTQTHDAILEGASVTQTELRRLQLSQDLSMAQMRLSNVQSEIRAIEREVATPVTRKQLGELRASEAQLRRQINSLSAILNPPTSVTSPATTPKGAPTTSSSSNHFIWLFFSLSGRLTRGGYWLGIAVAIALFAVTSLLASLSEATESNEPPPPFSCLVMILFILFVWIGTAVSIKRYHDLGKSGVWVFIILIPLVGIIWQLIELGLFPGTPSPNQYG